MLPSQGLPEYSTGKSGAAPTQLQVKDPRVLRQAVPGSQSSSLLSHSSKSVRHFGNKTDLLSGLEGCGEGYPASCLQTAAWKAHLRES